MAVRILHVLDETTPPDAVEVLARIVGRHDHRLAAVGHRSTEQLARAAGIGEKIDFVHSMGWADPTGWRGVRRLVREYEPTHVHAWGIPAAIAVTMSRYKGRRLVSLADMPRPAFLRMMQFIHKGGLWVSVSPCHWTVTTSWLKRELHAYGIAADAVSLIRPAECPGTAAGAGLREQLGIMPGDGPVLLLGGEGGAGKLLAKSGMDPAQLGGRGGARHDLGLWAAGILQLIFPKVRAVVREDPRGLADRGLERLMDNLPDLAVPVVAAGSCSWQDLLGLADVLVVTPDGPFAAGSILQAFAAGVPVIGTPVDAVKEHVTDGVNGLVAASTRPREIAAAVEKFFAEPGLREKLTQQARADVEARHDLGAMVKGYDALYE
jgi:hypothetical protein